jgi:hypothetical protein
MVHDFFYGKTLADLIRPLPPEDRK